MTDSWKSWLWRTAITVGIITVLAACFYATENARGLNAWEKCERELAARGESLNWNDYLPAAVPDDQNFYQAPMMTEWFVRGATNPSGLTLSALNHPDNSENDITEFSASNYIAWSAVCESALAHIRSAAQRPASRMAGDYSRPFSQPVPNFVSYRVACQMLAHRAKCYLLLNEPAKALTDLTLLHQLSLTLVRQNRSILLVGSMVHTAIAALYIDAIACGTESHLWNESELVTIQKQLAEFDLLVTVGDSFRGERAGVCHMLDMMQVNEIASAIGIKTNFASELGSWFVPNGWIQQNKAVIATLESTIIEAIDFTNKTVSPAKAFASSQRVERALDRRTPYNFIALVCIPNFTKAVQTAARNQTWVDHAQIACALERYRLANGKFPPTLAALTTQFIKSLPHDVISGKDFHYTCKDGEHFSLYSIGWNETDDGGVTARDSSGREDREHGDWVWRFPTQ